MKVTIVAGADTKFDVEVPEGATAEVALGHADVITVCGEQGAARIAGTEVPVNTPLKEGDELEPVSKANEKAAL